MHKNLEDLSEDFENLKFDGEPHEISLSKKVATVLKENLRNVLHPKFDLVNLTAGPMSQFSMLWHLDPKAHEYFIEIIDDGISYLKKINPKSATYLGVFNGLSKIVYGLKTKKGEDTLFGLLYLAENLKETEDPKVRKISEKAYHILNRKPFIKKEDSAEAA